MKILLLAHGLPVGGAEVMIANLARWLARHGTDVEVGCLDSVGSLGTALLDEGIPVVRYGRRPGRDFRLPWRIARHVRRRGIDLIHAHQMTAFVYGALARLIARVPLVFTEHGRFFPDLPSPSRRRFNRVFASSAARVTAVSSSVRRSLVTVEGFSENAIEVIYNGVDIDRFASPSRNRTEARARIGAPADAFVAGTVGRLHPDKGQDRLLRAAASLRRDGLPVFVAVVGEGSQREALTRLGEELGLSTSLSLLGETRDVETILPGFDAFVLPSRTEGTPVTLLEAMAARLPIVATAVGGIPEILEHDRDALLVPPGNGDIDHDLASALRRIATDSALAQRLASAAFDRVSRDFPMESIFRRYRTLYREALGIATRDGLDPADPVPG